MGGNLVGPDNLMLGQRGNVKYEPITPFGKDFTFTLLKMDSDIMDLDLYKYEKYK